MYLLDTNVWLERLLNQARAPEVEQLLDALDASELALSDFSLHSIGVILGRSGRLTLLDQFTADLFVRNQVTLFALTGAEIQSVTAAMRSQRLDFDDGYQYVVARRDQLTLVSFDTDFDHTDLARQTPAQVLAALAPPPPPGQA
jgi:predicted nucleic acid-binding protein